MPALRDPASASHPAVERYGPQWTPPPFERGTDGPRVILVGVDGSDASLRAAAYAGGLARRQRCHLVVVYSPPAFFWGWAIPGAASALQHTMEELESDLRTEVQRLAEDASIPVSLVRRHGHPYTCLRSVAEEVSADIVVVGAPRATIRRLGASVATQLIRLGRWPITVVP